MPGKGRKLTSLTIKQKIQILHLIDQKAKSKNEIARHFRCDISTVNRIWRNRQQVEEAANATCLRRKRLRTSPHNDIEKALAQWFDQMRALNTVLTDAQILQKARDFAAKLHSDFMPTNGWLWRWKRRESIKFIKITGEAADADTEEANRYRQQKLQDLMKAYDPRDIFNADESGLFYKALPNGTLARKGTTVTGGKGQKARLTLLFLCNVDGSYKKLFAIGKSKNPRCFRGKSIPLPYYFQNKAWMVGSLWSTILKEFDREMEKENRKVLLFVDNAPCHKVAGLNLENVKVEFLPANTTSILQPLDQGVIHIFKVYFRQIMVRKQLLAIEKGLTTKDFLKTISILDALTFSKRAWWLVKGESIKNCFQKVWFFTTTYLKFKNSNLILIF